MLSKLTFSLVFVLMLALVAAGPALAQREANSQNLNGDASTATDAAAGEGDIGANGFVVYTMNGTTDSTTAATNYHGIQSGPTLIPAGTAGSFGTDDSTTPGLFPDLEALFRFGGTIELVINAGANVALDTTNPVDTMSFTYAEVGDAAMYRLAITEIMWGTDAAQPPGTATTPLPPVVQWIEVYNNGAALRDDDDVRLVFTENQRQVRDTVTIGTVDYAVVDRVSVVNRFGNRWTLKGQSGRTAVGDNGEPITNLVSMYRKRGTNADKSEYTGTPNFGDGTEGGQWIASVGRINMSGNFVGTPGAPHQDDASQITSAKAPASLPGTAIVINEIYNGGADSNDLRWIELHNTSAADVIIKNWEMEAVWNDDDDDDDDPEHQRVFVLPNSDNVKVLAGGYLLITNTHPADSVLAGGINVMDSNEFPKGATHRFIVTDVNLPDQDMMLVLRNGNDRNSNQRNGDGDPIGHEKIVDIAGIGFVVVNDDDLVTDVWPLRGWTQPGDINAADFDTGGKSLGPNVGQTYTRWDNKTRDNRLHNDDWQKRGFDGGLGYDPGVDSAVAPGTPGYAHNAQKANPADITDGEIVISEIMYDSGENGNLVQWIELYNSSFTKSAHLNGDWELEIRNIDTDVESYVDAKFKFDGSKVILPNQTLLLVSDRSSASDVVDNRVYNLYQKHRNDLGLSSRKSILLSSVGFHLELRYKTTVVDEVGNVMLDGPRRSVEWALPETGDDDMRYSIIRGFGTQAPYDGVRDMANDGTMESSWIMAQSVRSYYGHRDDVGSPGDRDGSPVPVSLSSFRPVRDKATGEVVIRWVTESELNNAGFNILRSETKDGEFKVINVKGIIAGHGTTSEKHVYTYTDTTAKPNIVYYYQIEDVSLNGERTTLRTTHLRGNVSAGGKLTTRWGELKSSGK